MKQTDYLTVSDREQLYELFRTCYQYDHAYPKIYWDSLTKKRNIPGNFLCYQNETLIAYLSFFLFEQETVYLSAMVHPTLRRQQIFSKLLALALPEIHKLGIHQMTVAVAKESEMQRQWLQSKQARYLHSEYRMECIADSPLVIENNPLILRQAQEGDVELIAKIDAICFDSDYHLMYERFSEAIKDADREIWLAYLHDECIGKVHINFNQEGAFIHEVGILPAKQAQGLGTILLKLIVNQLIKHHHDFIYLEVMTENKSALKLYERCQFAVTTVYDYWQMKV